MRGARAAAAWLLELGIRPDPDWLAGCIEYLESDESQVYTQAELNNLAKEQWLLNDLKDVCTGSLPPGLKITEKTVLNGKFVLQVNCALDVGTPAYQQYQKLKKINIQNIEETMKQDEKIPSHRMIKLYLTDGVQDVYGMEYKPMRNLSCDMTPGCKILLKGPVTCRRGMLLLEERHVEVLGGEVEDLAASNNLGSILSSLLGVHDTGERNTQGTGVRPGISQTIQPSPPKLLQQCTSVHSTRPALTNSSNDHRPMSNSCNRQSTATNNITIITNENRQPTVNDPVISSSGKPVARVTGVPVADNFCDDDIDLDQLAAIEEQATKQANKRPLWQENYRNNAEKKLKQQTTAKSRIDDFPTDDDLFEDDIFESIEAIPSEPSTSKYTRKFPIEVPSDPFIYIKQIKDMTETDRVGKIFRIKAQILKLLSKLSIGRDGWSLKCTLIDGTGCLDVDFTSEVLTKLFGYSPSHMSQLNKQIAEQPHLKDKAMKILNAAKQSLQDLNCIIEVTMLDVPKITELAPYTEVHAKMLNSRLAATDL